MMGRNVRHNDNMDVLDDCGLRKGYTLSIKEVHEQGAIHRAVHLYVFDQQGENLLLQKRSQNVDHYPNKYSISVVGHVNAGEYSYAAVKRELMEELGVHTHALDIEFLFSFRQDATLSPTYIDRQINDVYVCYMDDTQQKNINFDKKEVAEIKWVPFEIFKKMVEDAFMGDTDHSHFLDWTLHSGYCVS
ncbi:MAG: NUDIX domain-containing protein [Amoebophilaceae bacterium]|nr:NUDIX domain-containing protein [Amoebophilaceae bacterium]